MIANQLFDLALKRERKDLLLSLFILILIPGLL
jgi:hypothetical protein